VSHLTDVREQVEAWIDHLNQYSDFNYGNKRTVKIHNRHEPITTASDLAGMLYLSYTSYRGLFVEFARRLPGFAVDRSLAK